MVTRRRTTPRRIITAHGFSGRTLMKRPSLAAEDLRSSFISRAPGLGTPAPVDFLRLASATHRSTRHPLVQIPPLSRADTDLLERERVGQRSSSNAALTRPGPGTGALIHVTPCDAGPRRRSRADKRPRCHTTVVIRALEVEKWTPNGPKVSQGGPFASLRKKRACDRVSGRR